MHKRRATTPIREVAAQRIRAVAQEIGADSNYSRGWMAEAARNLGLSYSTCWSIINHDKPTVGTRVIDTVCKKLCCSVYELLEPPGM